jgi:hypothetical protein
MKGFGSETENGYDGRYAPHWMNDRRSELSLY